MIGPRNGDFQGAHAAARHAGEFLVFSLYEVIAALLYTVPALLRSGYDDNQTTPQHCE